MKVNKKKPLKKLNHFCVFVFIICFAGVKFDFSCTYVIKADDEVVLAGINEDYIEPRTKIWFFPSTKKTHGRVIWGYDRYLYAYQGGMNDQGLIIDINAVGFTGWKDNPEKPNFENDIVEHILTHYSTVDEVIEFFQHHDVNLSYGIFLVADAKGNSVVVEWWKNKLRIVHKKGDYQIATNFVQSEYNSPDEYNDKRYKIADQILRSQETPTVDLIRRVLSATCFEVYWCRTLYSIICDLKNKKVNLYHYHNFEEVVIFDLEKMLLKGKVSYAIPSLFKIRPFKESLFDNNGSELGARNLMKVIDEKGIKEGIKRFHEMKKATRTYNLYVFEEWLIRSMGLNYLSKNQTDVATEIFKLNVQLYPKSWQVYYDLAEAYRVNGNKTMAIPNYQRALEIKPDESKILKILKKLIKKN